MDEKGSRRSLDKTDPPVSGRDLKLDGGNDQIQNEYGESIDPAAAITRGRVIRSSPLLLLLCSAWFVYLLILIVIGYPPGIIRIFLFFSGFFLIAFTMPAYDRYSTVRIEMRFNRAVDLLSGSYNYARDGENKAADRLFHEFDHDLDSLLNNQFASHKSKYVDEFLAVASEHLDEVLTAGGEERQAETVRVLALSARLLTTIGDRIWEVGDDEEVAESVFEGKWNDVATSLKDGVIHLRDGGNRHVSTGEYGHAIEEYGAARAILDELSTAHDAVIPPPQELELLRYQIGKNITDCHAAIANQRISNASDLLSEDQHTKAEEEFQSILDYLEGIEQSDELIDELIETARSGHKQSLIGRANQRVQSAKEVFDDRKFRDSEREFEAVFEFVAGIDYEGETIAEINHSAKTGYVQSRIEQGREHLQRGVDRFEENDYYEARETFEAAREHLEDVRVEADQHDLEEQVAEIDDLIETCRANADRARRSLLDLEDADSDAVVSAEDVAAEFDFDVPEIDYSIQRQRQPRPGVEDDLRNELPPHEILTERFGVGGNADVHKIQLADSGEILALKVPRWQGTLSTEVATEFVREARTWERIDDYEHIVDIVEWGTAPYPWMLLEFMSGGPLSDRIGQLEREDAVSILETVCEAVHFAHQRGVVHADLKPQNILFTDQSGEEVLKIGDWGLARLMLRHSKSLDELTPQYAAPEQIDPETHGSVDPLTDIYQVGVIAYELLTGRRPFAGEGHVAVTNAVLENDPVPPSEVGSELPREIDDVVLTALEKRKENRYETVLHFRDAIVRR